MCSDDLKKSYIIHNLNIGGYRNERDDWPKIQEEMIDAMIRMEKTFKPYVPEMNVT